MSASPATPCTAPLEHCDPVDKDNSVRVACMHALSFHAKQQISSTLEVARRADQGVANLHMAELAATEWIQSGRRASGWAGHNAAQRQASQRHEKR